MKQGGAYADDTVVIARTKKVSTEINRNRNETHGTSEKTTYKKTPAAERRRRV